MQQAIRLAEKGRYTTDPNPNVGCVMVKNNQLVGQGWHRRAGEPHAEVNALKQAGADAKDAIVFVTLEPCCHTGKTPPCVDALISAGVKKVYVAMLDPNPLVAGKGLKKLQRAGIDVDLGLLETQAQELNPGFIKRMQRGRPFVRVKLAMSMDGRTAMASGESQWISSAASRNDVQLLRAESSAVLTGIGTVLMDDPSMNVRLTAQQLGVDTVRQPKRIVLDSQFRMPLQAKIATPDYPTLDKIVPDKTIPDKANIDKSILENKCTLYTTIGVSDKDQYAFTVKTLKASAGQIDLYQLMKDLAEDEINLLHVEAGSVLSGALLSKGLVDEMVIYMAPHIMGANAKGLFHLPVLDQMKDRISLHVKEVRTIGSDIRITVRPVYAESS